jgi:4-amino-4-deoxy-L-arabinose transferase-like glycosyltransferase
MEFDEAYLYNAFASHSLWHVITDYHVPNNHVFLTIIVNFLVHVFGNHLWLMRLPSLLAGVLMVPFGYFTARRLYGINVGILSGVFISFFPILVKYSVLIRGYAIISLLTLLIILVGDYVRENKNRFAWMVFIVFCVTGFYTVPIMLFPVGAIYIWLLLSLVVHDVYSYVTPFEFLKYYIVSGIYVVLVTSLLYIPILLNPSNHLFGNKFVAPISWDIYPSAIYLRLQETWSDWVNVIPGWFVFLGVVGLIASFVLYKRIDTHRVPLQVAFLIWILGYSLIQRPDMETRMWVFFAAPLLIWSSSGLNGLLEIVSSYMKNWQLDKMFAIGILIVSVIFAGLLIPSIPERWAEKGSVENVVIYLKDNIREGDVVVTSNAFKAQLQYYLGLYEIPLKLLQSSSSFDRAFILVRSVGGSPDAGDTLDKVAPKGEDGSSLVNVNSSRIVQRYDDLVLYESYPVP